MREILFRGMDVNTGDWKYGFLLKYPSNVGYIDESPWHIVAPPKDPEDYAKVSTVVPDTVGQFTGLIDKNGRMIFEGDIVQSYDMFGRPDAVGTVYWDELFVAWHMDSCKAMYGPNVATYEVIGNIHDNSN